MCESHTPTKRRNSWGTRPPAPSRPRSQQAARGRGARGEGKREAQLSGDRCGAAPTMPPCARLPTGLPPVIHRTLPGSAMPNTTSPCRARDGVPCGERWPRRWGRGAGAPGRAGGAVTGDAGCCRGRGSPLPEKRHTTAGAHLVTGDLHAPAALRGPISPLPRGSLPPAERFLGFSLQWLSGSNPPGGRAERRHPQGHGGGPQQERGP